MTGTSDETVDQIDLWLGRISDEPHHSRRIDPMARKTTGAPAERLTDGELEMTRGGRVALPNQQNETQTGKPKGVDQSETGFLGASDWIW